MHSTGVALACLLLAAASVIEFALPSSWTLVGVTVGVALIGVPHGGLDHLTGRKLLAKRFPVSWPLIFFPAYVTVGLLVAAGWFLMPVSTAVIFFWVSAWHFGLEDDRSRLSSKLFDSIAAIAVGGMVIWVPVLFQSESVAAILKAVVPAGRSPAVSDILETSAFLSCLLLPFAAIVIARDLLIGKFSRGFRNSSFFALFAVTDVLLSFGLYFCSWHSIRGLKRLADDHHMRPGQLAAAAAPLSLAAIAAAGLGMWLWSSGQGISQATSRTVFVALSALAVPHLLLHGPITDVLMKCEIFKAGLLAKGDSLAHGEAAETAEVTV